MAKAAALSPDVVAVSGDLTQRARRREFAAARAFLRRLPGRQVVVPGNHDVPLYDLVSRFFRPLARYRAYVGDERFPTYEDDSLIIVGVTSARGFTISGGRLSRELVDHLSSHLGRSPRDAARVKALVCHHPIDLTGRRGRGGTADGHVALPELAALGIDLVLTGHMHAAGTVAGALPTAETDHGVLHVSAGTATSTRVRGGESNSFNLLRIGSDRIAVERHVWRDEADDFVACPTETFERHAGLWSPSHNG